MIKKYHLGLAKAGLNSEVVLILDGLNSDILLYCQFGHRCPAVINDGNQADGGEPADFPVKLPAETASPREHACVKRVTEKKAKDPKQVAAGRAGAVARQTRLLKQLQAAKESLRPPVSAADNDDTSASPKEAKPPKCTDEWPEPNWIPWIKGACLAGLTCVCLCGRKHVLARQSRVGDGRPRARSPG